MPNMSGQAEGTATPVPGPRSRHTTVGPMDDEAVLLMGVSGSGKTAVGHALADLLGWAFEDGDDLHPPANVAKMAAGHPLDDSDRAPWLAACGDWLVAQRKLDRPAILACSALK